MCITYTQLGFIITNLGELTLNSGVFLPQTDVPMKAKINNNFGVGSTLENLECWGRCIKPVRLNKLNGGKVENFDQFYAFMEQQNETNTSP